MATSQPSPLHSLREVAHKLALLVDKSTDWMYAFVWLQEALSHTPLLSEGHVSTMTDGTHCADTHGWLHQLQICKLLQHKDMVVCPEGFNSELEALQFTFQELPLWDAAAPGEPINKPQLIELDLGSKQHESVTTTIQAPTTTPVLPSSLANTVEPPSDITMASTCSSRGSLNSCSRLPPQPQPLSHGTVCQEESCHWQPWGLCSQLEKQKIPSGRGDGLSHPCPDGNPHTDVSMGGHTR